MRAISELLRQETYQGHCTQHGHWSADYSPFVAKRMENLCPTCLAEPAREDTNRLDANKRVALATQRSAEAQIPRRYWDCSFANFRVHTRADADAKIKAEEYAANLPKARALGRSLLLMGPPGTGKTYLGVSVLKHVIALGNTARFLDVWSLVDLVRETYSGKDKTKRGIFSQFIEPDILLLDHVVPCHASADESALVRQLIHRRYDAVKPTILTTYLTLDQLRGHILEAGLDRLREAGGIAIVFDRESHRRGALQARELDHDVMHGFAPAVPGREAMDEE